MSNADNKGRNGDASDVGEGPSFGPTGHEGWTTAIQGLLGVDVGGRREPALPQTDRRVPSASEADAPRPGGGPGLQEETAAGWQGHCLKHVMFQWVPAQVVVRICKFLALRPSSSVYKVAL